MIFYTVEYLLTHSFILQINYKWLPTNLLILYGYKIQEYDKFSTKIQSTIDEISKYLLKQSKKKGFPDISKR